ncbi:MAG: 30S ribosomal protein S30e [Candidatus Bathyarchaeia archaeon]
MPSHGSLSKAGKVRSITPKIESKTNSSPGPKLNNRKLYNKRILLGRNNGQHRPGRRRYRRRR